MTKSASKKKPAAKASAPAPEETPVRRNLRRIMEEKGLSQRAVAKQGGCNNMTIGRILSGALVSVETATLVKIAAGLGVPTTALLDDGAASAPAVAAVTVEGDAIRLLRLDEIEADPDQPRKTFDDASLDELAASIAAQGLLQNLIVRPTGVSALDGACWRLISGERRWRALRLLAARGQWDETAAIVPARVHNGDDASVRAIALIENLQRQDVPPLEEADAFIALNAIDPAIWTPRHIAEAIGMSKRYVQQRMQLATRLVPEARELMVQGKLGVDRARELVVAAPSEQKKILKSIAVGASYLSDAQGIRNAVQRAWIPVETAAFDADASGLEIVEDEVEDEEATDAAYEAAGDDDENVVPPVMKAARFFTDPAAFKKAQRKAADAKVAELAEIWAWAKFEGDFSALRYTKSRAKKLAGAVVTIDRWTNKVEVHTGLVAKPEEAIDGNGDAAHAAWDARQKVRRDFEAALGEALASQPGVAMRLLALALLGDARATPLPIAAEFDRAVRLAPWRRKFAEIATPAGEDEASWDDGALFRAGTTLPAWDALAALPDAAITALLVDTVCDALNVAGHFHLPVSHRLVAALGLEAPADVLPPIGSVDDDDDDDAPADEAADADVDDAAHRDGEAA